MRYVRLLPSIVCALVTAVFMNGCEKETTPAERMKQATDSVGLDASFTATFMANAVRSCYLGGYAKLPECAQNSGNLVQDIAARTQAQIALEHSQSYYTNCQKNFAKEYCDSLLNRAFAIEWQRQKTGQGQ